MEIKTNTIRPRLQVANQTKAYHFTNFLAEIVAIIQTTIAYQNIGHAKFLMCCLVCCQIFGCQQSPLLLSSQILAKSLANPGRWNPTPNNWQANIGRAAIGKNQTFPKAARQQNKCPTRTPSQTANLIVTATSSLCPSTADHLTGFKSWQNDGMRGW